MTNFLRIIMMKSTNAINQFKNYIIDIINVIQFVIYRKIVTYIIDRTFMCGKFDLLCFSTMTIVAINIR